MSEEQKSIATLAGDLNDDKHKTVKAAANEVVNKLKAWDEKMVQRLSKAYDDVENYPNKFSANYLYLINASESEIPRVNQGSKDRKAELDAQWAELKAEGS